MLAGALGLAGAGFCWAGGWNLGLLLWFSSCICWLKPSGSSSDVKTENSSHRFDAIQWWHLNDRRRSVTIFEVEAEPVESRVEIPSVQHAALHRVLNVLPFELKLLQGCVQVLGAQTKQPERNFSRAVYRSWGHKQNNLNATFSHGNISQCQGDDFVFTSNFLVVSLPDMGPLSPFSSLKSLISLMIFFSRSAWMVICLKRPNHYQRFQCFSERFSLDKMDEITPVMYSILLCYKLHNRQTEGNSWLTLRIDLSETPPVSTWAALARL